MPCITKEFMQPADIINNSSYLRLPFCFIAPKFVSPGIQMNPDSPREGARPCGGFSIQTPYGHNCGMDGQAFEITVRGGSI